MIKYGNRTVSISDLPEGNLEVLVQRTVNHIMQNEVAAKVKTARDAWQEANPDAELSEFDVESVTEAFRNEQWQRITSGDMSLRSTGPRGTALETTMRDIAWEEIREVLKTNKITMPKKAGDKISLKDGSFTKAELIDRRLAKFGDRIKAEAERRHEQAAEAATDL